MLTDGGIDARTFWKAIGARAVGAAVVTTAGPQGRAGFFALSATHLTASPPTIMVSIDGKTSALDVLREGGCFAVNYLPDSRQDLVALFSGKAGLDGDARFTDGEWTSLASGAPILRDAVGVLDCTLEEIIERHGTAIAIGRLVAFEAAPDRQPLVSFRGGYL